MATSNKDQFGENRNLSPNQFKGVYSNTAGERKTQKTGDNGPTGSYGKPAPGGSFNQGTSTVWGSAII